MGADLLSIAGSAEPAFNPYEHSVESDRKPTGNTSKTDLRRLSEWIKLMRSLEEQKKKDDGGCHSYPPALEARHKESSAFLNGTRWSN